MTDGDYDERALFSEGDCSLLGRGQLRIESFDGAGRWLLHCWSILCQAESDASPAWEWEWSYDIFAISLQLPRREV